MFMRAQVEQQSAVEVVPYGIRYPGISPTAKRSSIGCPKNIEAD